MKQIYPIILLLFLGTTAKVYGQNVYASKVLEVSREYSAYPGDNCAAQILGTTKNKKEK